MILIVLSDIDSSPIHLAIIQRLKILEQEFHVLIIGSDNLKIIDELLRIGVDYSLIQKNSKPNLVSITLALIAKFLQQRPSVVYSSGQFATLFAIPISYFFGIKYRIFTRHHSNLHHKPDMKVWLALDKLCNHFASQIVVVSETLYHFLIKTEKVKQKKLFLINNGIDLNRFQVKRNFSRFEERNESSLNDPIKFGVVARLTEWKGVAYTAEAFVNFCNVYPNSHLTIVGEASDAFSEISDALSFLPESNYKFISHCEDVPEFFSGLDLFIHVPIGSEEETFGLVYLEALATGIPCIFTLSGVMHDFDNPVDYCEIVPFRDSSAILDAMLRFTVPPILVKSQIPEQLLEYYSLERMSAAYSNLFTAI